MPTEKHKVRLAQPVETKLGAVSLAKRRSGTRALAKKGNITNFIISRDRNFALPGYKLVSEGRVGLQRITWRGKENPAMEGGNGKNKMLVKGEGEHPLKAEENFSGE